ncbi:MAG: hypothetical protein JSW11_07975 [Candidatus Heimdallarchaeota archaeon]|nr:MAG: hypothetical protein JSW11_07975 [Candidatus Heimdallarchaeota archaeon]
MLNKLRNRLENHRPCKGSILKMIPLIVFLTILLLGTVSGVADPTTTPPNP